MQLPRQSGCSCRGSLRGSGRPPGPSIRYCGPLAAARRPPVLDDPCCPAVRGGGGSGTGTVVLRALPGPNMKNRQGSYDHASTEQQRD